jgi:hypothetical protein
MSREEISMPMVPNWVYMEILPPKILKRLTTPREDEMMSEGDPAL